MNFIEFRIGHSAVSHMQGRIDKKTTFPLFFIPCRMTFETSCAAEILRLQVARI